MKRIIKVLVTEVKERYIEVDSKDGSDFNILKVLDIAQFIGDNPDNKLIVKNGLLTTSKKVFDGFTREDTWVAQEGIVYYIKERPIDEYKEVKVNSIKRFLDNIKISFK